MQGCVLVHKVHLEVRSFEALSTRAYSELCLGVMLLLEKSQCTMARMSTVHKVIILSYLSYLSICDQILLVGAIMGFLDP